MSLFNKKESKLSNYLDGYKKTNKSLAVKITELLGGYSANNDDIYEVKPKRKFFKKKDNNKMLNEKNEKFKEDEIVVRNQILKY